MLDSRKFETIFKIMEDVFSLINKELLLDEWVREKTQIIFAQTNYPSEEQNAQPQQICFYRREKDTAKKYQIAEEQLTEEDLNYIRENWHEKDCEDRLIKVIDNWVNENCGTDKKWIERACSIELEEHQVHIWCICCSVCLSENEGKRLFELTFRGWLDRLYQSGWYDLLEIKNQKRSDEPFKVESLDGRHRFVQEVLQEASQKMRKQIQSLYAPIEIADIVNLSGEYYEKADCQSNLLFLPPEKVSLLNEDVLIYDFRGIKKERRSLEWENIRFMRKLSQIAQKELYLLFTAARTEKNGTYEVLGICKWSPDMQGNAGKRLLIVEDQDKLPFFIVKIRKHLQFDIYLGNVYIFSCWNGNDRIRMGLPEKELIQECKTVFGESCDFTTVVKSLEESQRQSHGTMIVILGKEDAAKEAKRLSDKQYGIKDQVPRKSPEHINKLNAIDGSVLMDHTGKIHGIGMMLDGSEKTKGDIAKGTRHNSANKYHEYLCKRHIPGIILVVSEDGTAKILISKPLEKP